MGPMTVAAYASLLSLSKVLDRIQHPSMHRLPLNARQIETLQENIYFLQEILELHFQGESSDVQIEDLARQIADVAYQAESIIDSHVVNKLHGGSESTSNIEFESFFQDIDQVIEKIDSIKEDLMVFTGEDVVVPGQMPRVSVKAGSSAEEEIVQQQVPRVPVKAGLSAKEGIVQQQVPPVSIKASSSAEEKVVQVQQQVPRVSIQAGSSALPSSSRNTMVGLDDNLLKVMSDIIRGGDSTDRLKVIPIVGMGGIGKTTLATSVFEHQYNVEQFDIRAWSTISQEYRSRDILLGLLCGVGVFGDQVGDLSELGLLLHKSLSGRRYLIVLDDVWSTEAWDDLRRSLPDDSNGSRIVVTTRLLQVAVSLGPRRPHLVCLLTDDESWKLFCIKVFAQESCSPELEESGRRIARSCRGLPLAIVVIGGFLAKSNMTREYWESVAENVSLYANLETDEQCLRILALSYHHLPIHLKPCFVYMRVFPEDHEVQVSKLIKLWIAEGLLKPSGAKRLEDVAEEYLKDLTDRSLILIRKQGRAGKIKTCGIHDLLRDLCIREYPHERILCVPKVQYIDLDTRKNNKCFLCSDRYIVEEIQLVDVILGSQSLIGTTWACVACKGKHPQLPTLKFVNGMLEVDVMPIEEFPQPTTVRYLTVNCDIHLNFSSFSSIHLLWNLHTLIFDGCFVQTIFLPSAIWEMPQLRHIKIRPAVLPYPEKGQDTILENLHTLSEITDLRFTMEILARIPNMRKLRITYFNDSGKDKLYHSLENLAYLRKLESLYLKARIFSEDIIAFPDSLKKLVLDKCKMPWRDMGIIGSLPNLEELKLNDDAFEGDEWNAVEGQFCQLKVLSISWIDLVRWNAEDIHFPCLESLELQKVDHLEEILLSIGDIYTLQSIHLYGCKDSVINSAKAIIEEQQNMGNDDLQLYVTDEVYWRRRYEIGPSDSQEEGEEEEIEAAAEEEEIEAAEEEEAEAAEESVLQTLRTLHI